MKEKMLGSQIDESTFMKNVIQKDCKKQHHPFSKISLQPWKSDCWGIDVQC